jgi:plastocyanin
MSLRTKLLILLCATALLGAACGGDDDEGSDDEGSGGSGGTTVTAEDFSFSPDSLSVEAGAEVDITLQNDGDVEHSFTSDDLDFEVEAEGGESASGTFTAPDEDSTLEFHCKYHPDQMTGEITVGSGGTGAGGGGDDGTGEGKAENDDGVDY